jgi:hypothetical protein
MAMDEIQDTTINRNRLRLEQIEFLDRQFSDFVEGKAEHRDLGNEVLHLRVSSMPLLDQSLPVTSEILAAFDGRDPTFYDDAGNAKRNDVAFRNLHSRWVPVLRGMKREYYFERTEENLVDFQYVRKVIKSSGVCLFDYAATSHFRGETPVIHDGWLIGFFAQAFDNIKTLARVRATILPATVRIGVRSRGDIHLEYGSDVFPEHRRFPEDVVFFPDFVVNSEDDLDELFTQVQVDLYSILNILQESPYSLRNPMQQRPAESAVADQPA